MTVFQSNPPCHRGADDRLSLLAGPRMVPDGNALFAVIGSYGRFQETVFPNSVSRSKIIGMTHTTDKVAVNIYF